ncbi:MAG: mechanosensitive ion channel domain-containing protein [Rubrimonas sp.]
MRPEDFGVTPDLLAVSVGQGPDQLVLTLLAILIPLAVRQALIVMIRRRSELLSDRQRWWISTVRNTSVAIIFGALVVIWSSEIEAFALSIAAFAVALVVATKELLVCIAAAVWRGVTQPFTVGDWIEIGPWSGEVIEESLLSTTLQELDPLDFQLTGRVVSFPNSLLLTTPVVNNSFRKRFITLSFELYAEPGVDALAARERVLSAMTAACADHADLARRDAGRIQKSTGARLRDPTPQATLGTTELAKVSLRVTAFCPRDRAAAVRTAAVDAFLSVPSAHASRSVDGPAGQGTGAPG